MESFAAESRGFGGRDSQKIPVFCPILLDSVAVPARPPAYRGRPACDNNNNNQNNLKTARNDEKTIKRHISIFEAVEVT